ncbi:MAG: hypothetical protein KF906_00985 [Actinobacteria bacterium]|nr:hypothetical protein [Actinomycetota bacterium]
MASRWEVPADAVDAPFPNGATLRGDGVVWVLVEDDAVHRLGAVLAIACRAGASEVHVVVAEPADAAVLARRASLFTLPVSVWTLDGTDLVPAEAAPPADDPAPSPEAELYRPVLREAGLDPVVEGGVLLGELRGLEVARVVDADDAGATRVEAGVGRFDREAGAMMRAGMSESDSLDHVVDVVGPLRSAGAARHPMNQLVRERWLRSVLVADPALVDAAELRPVGSAVPRANLTEAGVASAVGVDPAGAPVVVTCSVGVDLDAVPSAADDRLSHAPDARLLLVVPAADAAPITRELVDLLAIPAELVTVGDDWATGTSGGQG